VDERGDVIDGDVPFQVNWAAELVFLLSGSTPAQTMRRFYLYWGADQERARPAVSGIRLIAEVEYEGQSSYRIETPSATYLYHTLGGGFASMIDVEGNDWLSYHPWGGSDGKFRGIPNLVHPEGYFHPGGIGCTSRIVSAGFLKVEVASESNDGKWACTWSIFPQYARLTVLKIDRPYWFLYEGTPGGILDELGDYCVRSNGVRTPASERWEGAIPSPEWLYFGASNTERVLYLVHEEADDVVDSYWPMEGNMTVFGFGRLGINKFMEAALSHFVVGFAESSEFDTVSRVIDSSYQPLAVARGDIESST
jgi:hypothetical protein